MPHSMLPHSMLQGVPCSLCEYLLAYVLLCVCVCAMPQVHLVVVAGWRGGHALGTILVYMLLTSNFFQNSWAPS